MKTQWQNPKRGWARALSCLLAFVLVCGTVLAAPPLDGAAWADPNDPQDTQGEQPQAMDGDPLDLEKHCSLTVSLPAPGAGATNEDRDERAALLDVARYDVYRVADAVKVDGYDTYAYSVEADSVYFAAIDSFLHNDPNDTAAVRDGWRARTDGEGALVFYATLDLSEDRRQQDFEELAQAVTGQIVTDANAPDTMMPSNCELDRQQRMLDAGLYLSLVHGDHAGAEEYDRYVVSVPTDEKDADGNPVTRLGTVAYTGLRIHTFKPMLVSLPGRGIMDDITGNDTTTGDWQYDVTVVTKSDATPRYASLEVTKHLRDYSQVVDGQTLFAQPVTVVFRVQATDPNTNEVKYEQIIPMSFSALGTQTRRLDNVIPVGSTVTVTEEYPGSNYMLAQDGLKVGWKPLNANDPGSRPYDENPAISNNGKTITLVNIQAGLITLTTPSGGTVVLEDGSVAQVEFTNVYRPVDQDGGSAVNSYLNTGSGWTWKQLTYDRETGQWVEAEQPYDPSQNNPNTPSQGN